MEETTLQSPGGPVDFEYAIRFGTVADCAPLVENASVSDLMSCPNAKCISGGFRINPDAQGVQSERCTGYIKHSSNVAQFCNFHIRYRVCTRKMSAPDPA